MHTRDYSDDTARVVDEEVERILREQEERASAVLVEHRRGLDAVAAALLEKETIDGAEVGRLIDGAHGRPVHAASPEVPHFAPTGDRPGSPVREAVPTPPLAEVVPPTTALATSRVTGPSSPDDTEALDRDA